MRGAGVEAPKICQSESQVLGLEPPPPLVSSPALVALRLASRVLPFFAFSVVAPGLAKTAGSLTPEELIVALRPQGRRGFAAAEPCQAAHRKECESFWRTGRTGRTSYFIYFMSI